MGFSLFQPTDKKAQLGLEQLMSRKAKDALLLLRKMLKEGLRLEKLPPPVRSRAAGVTAEELLALAATLAAAPGELLLLAATRLHRYSQRHGLLLDVWSLLL